MSPLENDERYRGICSKLTEMGTEVAGKVMGLCVAHDLRADQMTQIVDQTCEHIREELLRSTSNEILVDELVRYFQLVVIREGKRITIGLSMEGGTA